MSHEFAAGFQHGFFYGAASMALLAIGIWLACTIRGKPLDSARSMYDHYKYLQNTTDPQRIKFSDDGSVEIISPDNANPKFRPKKSNPHGSSEKTS